MQFHEICAQFTILSCFLFCHLHSLHTHIGTSTSTSGEKNNFALFSWINDMYVVWLLFWSAKIHITFVVVAALKCIRKKGAYYQDEV